MTKLLTLTAGLVGMFLVITPGTAESASAVAWAPDGTYGYSFNMPDEASASRMALRSCQKRTRSSCEVKVVCDGNGYGAISFRRFPGRVEAMGASCGESDLASAYGEAVRSCNENARTGRCGYPRIAWQDTYDEKPAPSSRRAPQAGNEEAAAGEGSDDARRRSNTLSPRGSDDVRRRIRVAPADRKR
jgi:hypothetical protein